MIRTDRCGSQPRLRGAERLEDRTVLSAGAPTVVDLHVAGADWAPAFVDYLHTHGLGDHGYRVPTGSSVQTKSLPWLNIDRIAISFSEDVNVDAGDLTLSGLSAASHPIAHFSYEITHQGSVSSFTATWTFASPLPKGLYLIDLDADGIDPVTDVAGNALDGEWANNSDVMPSGDGAAGGDFEFQFRVMPADANQSALVDFADYYAVSARQGLTTASANYGPLTDANGSGVHEQADLQAVIARLGSMAPTGTPLGAGSDAPTTTGGGAIDVNDSAVDAAFSLWDAFDDAATPDSQMSYEVVSIAGGSLFDSVSINYATGELLVNGAAGASGLGVLSVMATNAAGLSTWATIYANVNHPDQAPELYYLVIPEANDYWRFVGYVWDDDEVEGLLVEFSGVIELRATVQSGGAFEFAVFLPPNTSGEECGVVSDLQGRWSELVVQWIGVT